MKKGLAAEAFPSGKFGANAAWFRQNVICYNLISLFKRQTLPEEFWTAKPEEGGLPSLFGPVPDKIKV